MVVSGDWMLLFWVLVVLVLVSGWMLGVVLGYLFFMPLRARPSETWTLSAFAITILDIVIGLFHSSLVIP